MSVSTQGALDLAKAGANLEVTGSSGLTSTALLDLVKAVAAKGGHIKIHAANHSSAELLNFVKAAPSHVTIVL